MKTLMELFETIPMQSIGWAIVHTFWIGLIIWLAYILVKNAFIYNPRLRYISAYALQFSILIVFLLSLGHQLNQTPEASELVVNAEMLQTLIFEESLSAENPEILSLSELSIPGIVDLVSPILAMIWIFGAMLMMVKFSTSLFYVQTLRNTGLIDVNEEFDLLFKELVAKCGIKRNVGLFESELITSPLTIGHFKPLVLVPIGMLSNLNTEQVEAILLHELAHIRRHDYMLNLIQNLVESIVFFHPVVWILSAEIKTQRENLCDDYSVAQIQDPIHLVKALYQLEKSATHTPELALGSNSNNFQMLSRIKRLFENEVNEKRNFFGILPVILSFLLIVFLSFESKNSQAARMTDPVEPYENLATFTSVEPIETRSPKMLQTESRSTKSREISLGNVEKAPKEPECQVVVSCEEMPSTSIVIDDESELIELKTKGSDGRKIQISFSDPDNIESLKIDGKKIDEEDYDKYKAYLNKEIFGRMSFSRSNDVHAYSYHHDNAGHHSHHSHHDHGHGKGHSYSYSDGNSTFTIVDDEGKTTIVSPDGQNIMVFDGDGIDLDGFEFDFDFDLDDFLEDFEDFEDFEAFEDLEIFEDLNVLEDLADLDEETKREIREAIREVRRESMRARREAMREVRQAVKESKKQLQLHAMDKKALKEAEEELEEAMEEMEREMEALKEEEAEMQRELVQMQEELAKQDEMLNNLIETLVDDKIIDDEDDDIDIEFDNGEMKINGEKQDANRSKKYRDILGIGDDENFRFRRN